MAPCYRPLHSNWETGKARSVWSSGTETTHAGSIPRGEPLGAMLIDEEAGKPVDKSALQSNARSSSSARVSRTDRKFARLSAGGRWIRTSGSAGEGSVILC
jgi:hypothetical protein